MAKEKIKLVSNKGFLKSVRNIGLTTIDAVNELVDNSFDADANVVYISVYKNKIGNLAITVEDDGRGIPKEVQDEFGQKHDGLAFALSFGGRMLSPSDKILTGKFGWGLSSSACCQSTRTEVFSKTKDDDEFWFNYIDLKELERSEDLSLPPTSKANPAKEYSINIENNESGTIVVLNNCDKPDYTTVNGMVANLIKDLSEIHRRFIAGGKNIFVNGVELIPTDPLMLSPGCKEHDILGYGKEYAEIEPIEFDDIKDENGRTTKIRIKVSILDVKKIRNNPSWTLKFSEKHGIKQENQGFYLMRHNRQIGRALTFDLFTRHPSLNYFRGEILFPPALDKFFGIQTNKSRFTLHVSIKNKVEERLKGVLRQLTNDVEEIIDKIKKEQQKDEVKPSEKIAAKASRFLKRKKLSRKVEEKYKKEKEKQKAKEIKEVKEDKKLSEKEREENIKKIENKFQFERPFKLVLDTIGTGEFYTVKHKAKSTEVVLNVTHPFYKKIYEKSTQYPELQTHLDLFLFTLAHAEHLFCDNEEIMKFYKTQRMEWSATLATFLEESE